MSFLSRLEKYKQIDEKTGCWNWTGSLQNGYGQLNDNGQILRVHRIAAMLWLNFDIDSKELILHKCDNPRCFNPEHLYIGNKEDNANDYNRRFGVKNQNINKEVCIHGHEFTPENTRWEVRGSNGKMRRYCKRCERIKSFMRTKTGREWLRKNYGIIC